MSEACVQENVPSRFVSSSHVPRIGTVSSPARNAANAAAVMPARRVRKRDTAGEVGGHARGCPAVVERGEAICCARGQQMDCGGMVCGVGRLASN